MLEVSWNHSIIVLEVLVDSVKSPEHKNSLVANGTELNVAIFNVGVYLNLVDRVVPHNR